MTIVPPRNKALPQASGQLSAIEIEAMFSDARRGVDRRARTGADVELHENRRGNRADRRLSRSRRTDRCWWLQRNYVTTETLIFLDR